MGLYGVAPGRHGLIVTNMRDQVSWAFYIGNFTFLVGVAAAAVLLVIPAYVFADPDVTASFHAFNFDLQRDRAFRELLRMPATGSFVLNTLNTSLTEFTIFEPGMWRIVRYNDTAHLHGLPAATATS